MKLPEPPSLKYQSRANNISVPHDDEWLTVRMRYKDPQTNVSGELDGALRDGERGRPLSVDHRFAAVVAGFGMLLRDSKYRGSLDYPSRLTWAEETVKEKPDEYRQEFVQLVRAAPTLSSLKP